jgi:hypothetical protein
MIVLCYIFFMKPQQGQAFWGVGVCAFLDFIIEGLLILQLLRP